MCILELTFLCPFESPTAGTSVTISATKCNTEQRVSTCHRGDYMQQKIAKQWKSSWSALNSGTRLQDCYYPESAVFAVLWYSTQVCVVWLAWTQVAKLATVWICMNKTPTCSYLPIVGMIGSNLISILAFEMFTVIFMRLLF